MRKLLKKIEKAYETKTVPTLSVEEMQQLEKALQTGLVNRDAFTDVSVQRDETRIYRQITKSYPLSPIGAEIVGQNLYQRARKSLVVQVISDVLLVTAFGLTLWLTINQVANPSRQNDAKSGEGIAVESPKAPEPTIGGAVATPPKQP